MDLSTMLGPDPRAEIVKILHFLIAFSSLACLIAYIKPVLKDVKKHLAESRFLFWTVLLSAAPIPICWPLIYSYFTINPHPTTLAGLPWNGYILGLVMGHTGFIGRWADAEPSRVVQRIVIGSIFSLAGTLAVTHFFPIVD